MELPLRHPSNRLDTRNDLTSRETKNLDTTTRLVERQIENISGRLLKLSTTNASDAKKDANTCTPVCIGRKVFESSGGNKESCLLDKTLATETSAGSRCSFTHADIVRITKENRNLLHMLHEERLSKIQLREDYETQLAFLRSMIKKLQKQERDTTFQQLNTVICKYYSLAQEAASLARSERDRKEAEKSRIQHIAEMACKEFERQIKEQVQITLKNYRRLAYEAYNSAKNERDQLNEYCEKLETTLDQKRRLFEAEILQEAEQRIEVYRESAFEAQSQMEKAKKAYEKNTIEMCDTIELRCQEFQKSLYSKMLHVSSFKKHQDELEFQRHTKEQLMEEMSQATAVLLKEEVKERAQQKMESELQLRIRKVNEDIAFSPEPMTTSQGSSSSSDV